MQNDWSALMVASKKGHEDIVDYLVAHGADVNLQKEVRFLRGDVPSLPIFLFIT